MDLIQSCKTPNVDKEQVACNDGKQSDQCVEGQVDAIEAGLETTEARKEGPVEEEGSRSKSAEDRREEADAAYRGEAADDAANVERPTDEEGRYCLPSGTNRSEDAEVETTTLQGEDQMALFEDVCLMTSPDRESTELVVVGVVSGQNISGGVVIPDEEMGQGGTLETTSCPPLDPSPPSDCCASVTQSESGSVCQHAEEVVACSDGQSAHDETSCPAIDSLPIQSAFEDFQSADVQQHVVHHGAEFLVDVFNALNASDLIVLISAFLLQSLMPIIIMLAWQRSRSAQTINENGNDHD